MKRLRFCLLLSICLAAGVFARAQTPAATQPAPQPQPQLQTSVITLGQSIVPLNGPWKFHIGDSPQATGTKSPQWADPSFDDAQWETVDLTPKAGSFDRNAGTSGYVPGWTDKGHPGYSGYAWYRIRVRVDAQPGQRLALMGPTDVDDAYQVFSNGALLGSFGKFPGPAVKPGSSAGQTPTIYNAQPAMFHIAQPPVVGAGSGSDAAPATQVLALRVWMEPTTLLLNGPGVGGMHDAPLLGEAGVVAARYQIAWLATVRAYASQPVMAALFLLLALLAGSLIFFDCSDPVYGWLAAVFLLIAINYADGAVGAWTQLASADTFVLIMYLLVPLIVGAWVMVWWLWFRLRRPAWMPWMIAALTLLYLVSDTLGHNLFPAVPHPVATAVNIAFHVIGRLLLLLLALIVIAGIRRQGREGWLTLPAVLLLGFAALPSAWLAALGIPREWFPFGAQFALTDIVYIAFAATMFLLLLRRSVLSLRRQREMALDVKQAAEIQQVLIPQQLPQIPGLTIESEYRRAREVGGDFFQIVPHPADGSVLIVLGDVTGHGLQAGMLVALIVGAIRNEVAHTSDPLEMLNALNRTLCGRGHAHATCLALRIEANGHATLANAGHLAPYLNGKELPMEGALPLGMIEAAEFSRMQFQFNENDRLILMSDGVVEAQNARGELLGFDRVAKFLREPTTAANLAFVAQKFGQQDDILILRISRVPHPSRSSQQLGLQEHGNA